MAETRTTQIAPLRRAIDCLPTQTRTAMLTGINNNTIVVGAYTMDNGVCPMLAAHRNGGRTNFVAFARAWDEYCFRGVRTRRRRPRLATPTELAALRAHIESSLLAEDNVDLAGAMFEHRNLVARTQLEVEAEQAIEQERLVSEYKRAPTRAKRMRREDSERVAEHPERVPEPAARVPEPAARVPEPAARVPEPAERVRPGDPDRSRELSRRHGWRWMRIMRTYDEYEQAMSSLEHTDAAAHAEAERELSNHRG